MPIQTFISHVDIPNIWYTKYSRTGLHEKWPIITYFIHTGEDVVDFKMLAKVSEAALKRE